LGLEIFNPINPYDWVGLVGWS